MYVCVMCCGVVIEPIECRECQSLYCKGCIASQTMLCPKRCGGSEYAAKVNRLVMNTLNKLNFKCQFEDCQTATSYDQYGDHLKKCNRKRNMCDNPVCQNKIRILEESIKKMQTQIVELEIQNAKDQESKEIIFEELQHSREAKANS